MLLKAIGQDTQIEDCICGMSADNKDSLTLKIEFTKKHISEIISLNGSEIFHPIVKEENIYYFLSKAPEWLTITDKTERKYYYPIQYAEIIFFNNKP